MTQPSQKEILEKKLQTEAERRGIHVEELRDIFLLESLNAAQRTRKRQQEAELAARVESKHLLITVKQTERECLAQVAKELGIATSEVSGRSGHRYRVFTYKNQPIATEYNLSNMGPDEATHECLLARVETQAKTMMIVGTAFGADKTHKQGDVLLSDGVLPYDERNVLDDESGEWYYVYRSPVLLSSRYWLARILEVGKTLTLSLRPGILLSGGARIESERYGSLLVRCAKVGAAAIVGGDMETAAVASIATRSELEWIAVKGICDFAEAGRAAYLAKARIEAARNAAVVVLRALTTSAPQG